MKIEKIEVEISHTINVGKFESVKPAIRMVASLDEGDPISECREKLHKIVSKEWAKNAMKELIWVAQRREKKDRHEFSQVTEGTRQQLKGLINNDD